MAGFASIAGFRSAPVITRRPADGAEQPGLTEPSSAPQPPSTPTPHTRPGRHLLPMVLMATIIGAGAWFGVTTWRLAQVPGPLTASGTIEADEVLVSSEVSGRILTLPAVEGARVRAGDVVATLDDALPRLQFTQSDAATQRQLDVQLNKYTLVAPSDGVVTRVPSRIGEVALPGQPLLAFADLRQLKVTVYVLERDLDQVRVGQQVLVTADPFPGRSFHGTITSINQRAEFTPRNVQTQRDRLNLVFGVKVRVDNPEYALKPGMPIDATFQPLDEMASDAGTLPALGAALPIAPLLGALQPAPAAKR